MLLYVYLFAQIFLEAAAAFEPISLDFKRVGDVRNKRDNEAKGFLKVDDVEYDHRIYLSVGSNNDVVQVLVDFSSSDLVLVSSDAPVDVGRGTFNQSESTSFKKNETSFTETGIFKSGTGFWGQDDITIGNVTIKGLDFVVQEVETTQTGVLGLGLPEWESTYENVSDPHMYENLPMKLKSQGYISKVAYSVYQNPYTYYDNGGTLLFGAVNHAKYFGNLTTLPMIQYNTTGVADISQWSATRLIEERRFQVSLHGMKISGNGTENEGEIITIFNNTRHASIYPLYGSSNFPEPIVNAIATALGGSKSPTGKNSWTVPCVDYDDVIFLFDFGDFTLRVPASALVYSSSSSSSCSLSIGPTRNGQDFIILSYDIMQYAYMVYDLEDREVSIAQIKVSKKNDIQEIVSLGSSSTKGNTQSTKSTTQSTTDGDTNGTTTDGTTSDGTTTEPKESSLSSSKTSASSDAPSQRNSSMPRAVSLAWLMISCILASLLVVI